MTVRVITADVFDGLAQLDSDSVDCVVTSPPYWNLRDYGVVGQIGLEPTLDEYIAVIVQVFAEIHRVLKPSGTVWLNCGDCYASANRSKNPVAPTNKSKRIERGSGRWGGGNNPSHGVLKPKDLCMIPNRIAIALQTAGWWVRSEIIWAKSNPMPESVKDRPASAHEKIWLLTKSDRYFYDADEVLQPVSKNTHARLSQNVMAQVGSARANGGAKTNGNMKAVARKHKNMDRHKPHSLHKARIKDNESFDSALALPVSERNLRNYESAPPAVWRMSTAAFSDAHFATFPPELVERCLKAGCPKDGLVLDPFGGAGTTGLVADRMQRDCILIDLNPDYVEIAERRLADDRGGLLNVMET